MSLYSALYAGISGLSAQSGAMASVADNINNVNTIGYKGTKADFSSLVTGSRVKGSYAAGAVNLVSQALISKGGVLTSGTRTTDLGIEGAGFFVVRPRPGSPDVAFTRAGSFVPDKNGDLINQGGYYLQGWPIAKDGSFVDSGSFASMQTVNTSGLASAAEPTRNIGLQLNLDSRLAVLSSAAAYTRGAMASGAVPAQFSRPIDVYDAQGGTHSVNFGFIKTGPNQWKGEIYVTPPTDVTQPGGVLASGNVVFDSFGKLDVAASDPALFANLNPTWTNGAGTDPIKMSVNKGSNDSWTQIGSTSAVGAKAIDGGLLGKVTSVTFSKQGVVTAVYENGTTRDIYRLPLATFRNPDGLQRLSGDAFAASQDSGAANANVASAGGSGEVNGGKLEASTTDLAAEFSDMIRFQRAYSASSKIITTVDDMLQELGNLKR